MRNIKLLAAATAGLFAAGHANAWEIFTVTEYGTVSVYDTSTATLTGITDLSANHSVGQIVGLAYDIPTNTLYALDRSLGQVFGINASTGVSSVAFLSTGGFQGGAVKGGTLFGISEDNQTLEGYTISTGANLGVGGTNVDHSHALGIDAGSGQLYVAKNGIVYKMADDGTEGDGQVHLHGDWAEDLDWYNGDFIYVDYSSDVRLGSSGVTLFSASGNLTGVAFKQSGPRPDGDPHPGPVPEPASWAMMIGGFAVAGAAMRRRAARVAFA